MVKQVISYKELFDYIIVDEDNEVSEEYMFDLKNGMITTAPKRSFLKSLFKKQISGNYVTIPKVNVNELYLQFVKKLNNKKVNAYLELFGEDKEALAAYTVIYNFKERIYTEGGDFEFFSFEFIAPLVKEWAEKIILILTIIIQNPTIIFLII